MFNNLERGTMPEKLTVAEGSRLVIKGRMERAIKMAVEVLMNSDYCVQSRLDALLTITVGPIAVKIYDELKERGI